MQYVESSPDDASELAEIRALAMKPSLVALGRYDENRVRQRFLETFVASETVKVIDRGELLGFYVVRERDSHHYLDHLYIRPEHQNKRIGTFIVERVVETAKKKTMPVRVGALRGSRSNDFYLKNGFKKTHEEGFDIYYEYSRGISS